MKIEPERAWLSNLPKIFYLVGERESRCGPKSSIARYNSFCHLIIITSPSFPGMGDIFVECESDTASWEGLLTVMSGGVSVFWDLYWTGIAKRAHLHIWLLGCQAYQRYWDSHRVQHQGTNCRVFGKSNCVQNANASLPSPVSALG